MRTARLALALLLAFGSSQSAKLPGQNHHQGAQSLANSGAGGNYWWQNNNAFGGGSGGSRPATQASGNANAHASASSGGSSSSGAASGGGSYGGGSYGGSSQQSGNLQNAANPPQITVQQPQQGGFNPNVFTPDQSPHCARGQDCVRWQLCKNGVISLTGKNIPRQQPVPQDMSAKPCGMLGNVCCAIPAKIIATQQQLGHTNQVQTPNFQQPQQSLQQPQQSQQLQNYQTSPNQNQQSNPSKNNQQNFPRPSQQQFQNQASFPQTINNNNIQPEVPKGPPFPECSASLFCVLQTECNLYNGFIEEQIEQWPGQPFVQISMCTSDTLPEGVCCQQPHPENDPWPQDQQPSGSQQNNNFQQQVVQRPQGQPTQQFGVNGQQSKPQGNQGHSGSANRPQTNIQPPNTNTFQQPAIQQPAQAINFPQHQPRPQQNLPGPQPSSQQGYQQPSQNINQQPTQTHVQQPATNNFQHRPQNNFQQPNQHTQTNFQQPTQNFQQPAQNFQNPNQNFQQQQPNRPVNPSHNDNHMPNLNLVGLANQHSGSQGVGPVGPNEQFPALAPHPTCSSGLFCVKRAECNLYTGFIEEQVQTHPDQQFIAINLCTSPTLKEGVCCQQKRPPGAQDDGQYRGPGATNSGQQQTFVPQGSNPQQGFIQQPARPQNNNFVSGNPAPQQGFNQQPQQTVGNQHSGNNQHIGVQPGQQTQQQGGYDWQNSNAFQQQVPSYG